MPKALTTGEIIHALQNSSTTLKQNIDGSAQLILLGFCKTIPRHVFKRLLRRHAIRSIGRCNDATPNWTVTKCTVSKEISGKEGAESNKLWDKLQQDFNDAVSNVHGLQQYHRHGKYAAKCFKQLWEFNLIDHVANMIIGLGCGSGERWTRLKKVVEANPAKFLERINK